MNKIAVWGFSWIPSFAQGLVRDLRVRWALEEAGLDYESRGVAIEERKSTTHLNRHPFGMVPALEVDGETMIESGAIVFAIAENCDALMPAAKRLDTLTWMFAAVNTVEPSLWNLFTLDKLHGDEPWAKLRHAGATDAAKDKLAALADWLDGREYVLGTFSAADIMMATVLRFIRHTNLVAAYPTLDAYLKRCEARPAFQAALQKQLDGYAQHQPLAA